MSRPAPEAEETILTTDDIPLLLNTTFDLDIFRLVSFLIRNTHYINKVATSLTVLINKDRDNENDPTHKVALTINKLFNDNPRLGKDGNLIELSVIEKNDNILLRTFLDRIVAKFNQARDPRHLNSITSRLNRKKITSKEITFEDIRSYLSSFVGRITADQSQKDVNDWYVIKAIKADIRRNLIIAKTVFDKIIEVTNLTQMEEKRFRRFANREINLNPLEKIKFNELLKFCVANGRKPIDMLNHKELVEFAQTYILQTATIMNNFASYLGQNGEIIIKTDGSKFIDLDPEGILSDIRFALYSDIINKQFIRIDPKVFKIRDIVLAEECLNKILEFLPSESSIAYKKGGIEFLQNLIAIKSALPFDHSLIAMIESKKVDINLAICQEEMMARGNYEILLGAEVEVLLDNACEENKIQKLKLLGVKAIAYSVKFAKDYNDEPSKISLANKRNLNFKQSLEKTRDFINMFKSLDKKDDLQDSSLRIVLGNLLVTQFKMYDFIKAKVENNNHPQYKFENLEKIKQTLLIAADLITLFAATKNKNLNILQIREIQEIERFVTQERIETVNGVNGLFDVILEKIKDIELQQDILKLPDNIKANYQEKPKIFSQTEISRSNKAYIDILVEEEVLAIKEREKSHKALTKELDKIKKQEKRAIDIYKKQPEEEQKTLDPDTINLQDSNYFEDVKYLEIGRKFVAQSNFEGAVQAYADNFEEISSKISKDLEKDLARELLLSCAKNSLEIAHCHLFLGTKGVKLAISGSNIEPNMLHLAQSLQWINTTIKFVCKAINMDKDLLMALYNSEDEKDITKLRELTNNDEFQIAVNCCDYYNRIQNTVLVVDEEVSSRLRWLEASRQAAKERYEIDGKDWRSPKGYVCLKTEETLHLNKVKKELRKFEKTRGKLFLEFEEAVQTLPAEILETIQNKISVPRISYQESPFPSASPNAFDIRQIQSSQLLLT